MCVAAVHGVDEDNMCTYITVQTQCYRVWFSALSRDQGNLASNLSCPFTRSRAHLIRLFVKAPTSTTTQWSSPACLAVPALPSGGQNGMQVFGHGQEYDDLTCG